MRLQRNALVGACAAALLATSACASSDAGTDDSSDGTDGQMVIESFHALSGPVAPVGEAMSIGNKAAVSVLNDEGGVLGEPIKLNVTDDGGTSDELAAKTQELLAAGKPHAVLPGTAAEIPAAIPILSNAGVFTSQHFTSFNDPEKYPTVFGNAHTIPDYVESLVQKLEDDGYKSIGVVDSDDASGQAFREVAKPAFKDAGIKAKFVAVSPEAVDATPQLQQALADDPDALVFAGYYPGAPAVVAARAKLGTKVPTIAAQTFAANNWDEIAKPAALEGIEFQQLAANVKGTEQTDSEAFQKFYEAVKEESGGTLAFPINTYIVSYDDVMLAAYAAELAGSFDADEMVEAVEQSGPEDMPNYVMPTGFSPENHSTDVTADDFVFIPYAPTENGLLVPPGS